MDRQDDDVTTPVASERGTGTVVHVEGNRTSAEGGLHEEGKAQPVTPGSLRPDDCRAMSVFGQQQDVS